MKNHILKVSRPGSRLRSRSEKNSKTMTGNTWRLGILSLVVLNLLLGVSLAASKEPTFTTIDPPGSMFSWAVEINPAGRSSELTSVTHSMAICSAKGSSPRLIFLVLSGTSAFGINPAGDIVGQYFDVNDNLHSLLLSRKQEDHLLSKE